MKCGILFGWKCEDCGETYGYDGKSGSLRALQSDAIETAKRHRMICNPSVRKALP